MKPGASAYALAPVHEPGGETDCASSSVRLSTIKAYFVPGVRIELTFTASETAELPLF